MLFSSFDAMHAAGGSYGFVASGDRLLTP